MKGIDISSFQPGLEIQSIQKNGFDFAILKISEGCNVFDNNAPAFYMRARDAGLPVGGYCYSHATTPDWARAEAKAMVNRLCGFPMPLGLYIDVEAPEQLALPDDELQEVVLAFCEEIEAAGYIPGVYSSEYTGWSKLDPDALPADALIWVAHYGKEPEMPCDLWQTSETGRIPGFDGRVDVDVVRSERFASLLSGKPAAEPSDEDSPEIQPLVTALQVAMSYAGYWDVADGVITPEWISAARTMLDDLEQL